MSYRVEEVTSKKSKLYVVIEKGSELTVYESASNREARQMCRSLNLGAGFNGLTPAFFVEKFPVVKD